MASGRFTRLLTELILSAKIIDREVSSRLLDVLGRREMSMSRGDRSETDDFANKVIIRRMERAGVLCIMVSEENADVIEIPERFPVEIISCFRSSDGSANIDANVNGTIFAFIAAHPLVINGDLVDVARSMLPLDTSFMARRPCWSILPVTECMASPWTRA